MAKTVEPEPTLRTATITTKTRQKETPVINLDIQGLDMPESIAINNNILYIANIGGLPMESQSKGFITQVMGGQTYKLFEGVLDDPKGFVFLDNDTILISDHPHVKILQLSTQKILASKEIFNAGFLNDMVLINSNTAILSDTIAGKAYKISWNSQNKDLIITEIKGINVSGITGLTYDTEQNILYFVSSTFGNDPNGGQIYQANSDNNWISATNFRWNNKQIGAGGLDGLALSSNNKLLLLSDWGAMGAKNNAVLYIYNIKARKLKNIISNFTRVTDLAISENKIYIPELTQNQIVMIKIP